MGDAFSSLVEMFKDRAKSRFWPTFIFVFIVHNWKFFYILIAIPYDNTLYFNSLRMAEDYHSKICNFYIIPLIISISLNVAIPYLDVIIGYAQHKALFWNKNQSTELSLKVAREKTRLEKEILAEVIEQKEAFNEANKLLEEQNIQSKKRKTSEIFDKLNSIIDHEMILAAIDSYDNNSDANVIRTDDIDKYSLTSKIIGNQFPDKDLQVAHTDFIQKLMNFKEINSMLIDRLRRSSSKPMNLDISQNYKITLDEVHQHYLTYRNLLQSKYSI